MEPCVAKVSKLTIIIQRNFIKPTVPNGKNVAARMAYFDDAGNLVRYNWFDASLFYTRSIHWSHDEWLLLVHNTNWLESW